MQRRPRCWLEPPGRAVRQLCKWCPIPAGTIITEGAFVELSSNNSIAASGRVFVKTLGRRWRRALLRLRKPREKASDAAGRDAASPLFQQALRDADARLLFAMLNQPPARAIGLSAHAAPPPASGSPRAACQVVQIGGQLGLVLTLGGKLSCVLPLEARQEEAEALSL